ncbi:MAG: response regulator [Ilumatobacter sp.]
MIRVLVADDQEMVRTGIEMILRAADDIEVVASVPDGRSALSAARELRPTVCLLDVRMPHLDGIQVCKMLMDDPASRTEVVIVTTFDDDEIVDGALSAGAAGFLLKTASAALVLEAVRAAATGDQLVAPEVTGRLLRRLGDDSTKGSSSVEEPIDRLSPREEEVVALVAAGLTNAEIGERLHLSLATVKTHVNSVLTKLGARNRVEVAAFAFRSGRAT